MNKILLLCLFGGLLGSGGYGLRLSGLDFNDDFLDHEAEDINGLEEGDQDQDAKLAESCLVQILGPSVSCIMRSLTKWSVNPYQLKTDINHKPTCCSIWEMTDCLKNNAKVHCSMMERTAFETHMNSQTLLRNEKNCSLFHYQSKACSDGQQEQDESPVFNKVSFRENNHFIDTNQLDDDIQPKRRHTRPSRAHPVTSKVFNGVPSIGSLDELTLAQRLLDRVDRITINHMIIDLHPVKRTDTVPKQDLGDSQIEVEGQP